MPFVVTCGGCKKKLKIPDALVGKPVKCPGCAGKINTKAKPSAVAKAAAPAATKTTPTDATGKTKPAAAPKSAGAAAAAKNPAKETKAAKTTAMKSTAPPKSAPDPAPAVKKPTPSKPASPPAPVLPKTSPPAAKPMPAPARRSSNDDDEGIGATRLVIFGGGFVLLSVLIFAAWWLFFSATPLGTLSGTVTLDGEPLDKADLAFVGLDDPKLNPFKAQTLEDGTYQSDAGIAPGVYKVMIDKLAQVKGSANPEDEEADPAAAVGKSLLLPEYNNPEKSILRATIKAGSNRVNFDLKSKLN